MLLTVLVLAAVFLSVTVIAGLLMVYQLSQVTRIVDSAEAIFAADAALERGLFQVFRCNVAFGSSVTGGPFGPLSNHPNYAEMCDQGNMSIWLPPFYNEASYKMEIFTGNNVSWGATPLTVTSIKATGRSGKSARAFEIGFE